MVKSVKQRQNINFFFGFSFYFFCAICKADNICLDQIHGINLAGAEFSESRIPGVIGKDYRFPTLYQLKFYRQSGFNAVRLPLLWERLQPSLFGELDSNYSKELLAFMQIANQTKLPVVVDIHNYARYRSKLIGELEVPPSALKDLWIRLALLLKNEPALYAYGLMNEPHNTNDTWHLTAQYGVDGIRAVDQGHKIFVSGDSWSSTSTWPKANPIPFVIDPSEKVVYEAHVYFDDDSSGRYKSQVVDTNLKARVNQRINPFFSWLRKYNQKGVIGEWGVPTSSNSYIDAVDEFVHVAKKECIDWFIWAGGEWSAGYSLAIPPYDDGKRPILNHLKLINTYP